LAHPKESNEKQEDIHGCKPGTLSHRCCCCRSDYSCCHALLLLLLLLLLLFAFRWWLLLLLLLLLLLALLLLPAEVVVGLACQRLLLLVHLSDLKFEFGGIVAVQLAVWRLQEVSVQAASSINQPAAGAAAQHQRMPTLHTRWCHSCCIVVNVITSHDAQVLAGTGSEGLLGQVCMQANTGSTHR
jgi:hypothetical protein